MVNVVTPFSSSKWDVNSKESSRIKRSLTLKAKASFLVAFILVTLVVVVVVICFLLPRLQTAEYIWPSYVSQSKLGKYRSAAISSDAAPCAPIGRDIFKNNGTAVDAAIAVLLCMGAHNPHSMGLGGGFLMLYYNRSEQKAHYLDAREVAPRNSSVNMFSGNAELAAEGGLSIAVPGELAGYVEAHRLYGRLPWRDLFTPTIKMCNDGIVVSPHLAKGIAKVKKTLMKYPAIRNVFLKNGSDVYEAGEKLKMPDLARTLNEIAEQGLRALYGPSNMSEAFLRDLKDAGSIIDKIDMQNYAPVWRDPVKVNLRKNTTLYGVSPPGSGALLAFMMAVLDGYEDMNESVVNDNEMVALTYHRIAETFKFSYAFRSLLEDDETAELKELLSKLASKEYANEIRNKINDTMTFNDLEHYGVNWYYVEDHGTAHLSLIAPNGDAVSVTSTINQYFGSKILSPSTGIVLNDEMDDFSSPNITNSFELPPTPMNRIRPGKRPMSSMTPIILVDGNGDAQLVLGGNGGTMITSGVMQTAARCLFFGEDIKQSIDAPRIHHQLTPNILHYEENFSKGLVDALGKFGHHTQVWNMGMMSIIMGVQRGKDGYLYANSDYRKGGDVDGF